MKAIEIRIHNFRSIEDAAFELAPYSLLIGPNNAGKSNVIAALRVFYEDLKYDKDRDFPKFPTADKESWIEIEYQPEPDEWEQLKDEYKLEGGTFRVRKYLKSDEVDDEGKKRDGIYAYVKGSLSGSRFYGAKNVQQGKLGSIIFIPAVSKLDEQTKLSGPSPLRDLLNVVLKDVLDASPSYQELAAAFDEFGQRIKQEETREGHSLGLLEKEITAELSRWDARFELIFNPVRPEDIVKTIIDHQVVDGSLDEPLAPSAFGHGFQRNLIFTLIRLAAKYGPKKARSVKKEFSPSLTWILFEEPEAFLHPSQVDILHSDLRTFAAASGQQVTICTHSPQFASLNIEDIPALVRLNRENGQTSVGQVRRDVLPKLLEDNQALLEDLQAAGETVEDDDLQVDMEAIKYALWLNPLRSTAFFAPKVLLVEGPSEVALLGVLINEGRLKVPQGEVAIVDTMGKWNTVRFMNLLGRLRVPHCVLYDRDRPTPVNVTMEKAIRDARNEYTMGIDCFEQDIESFLDVPKPKKKHRKPQHLMWYLRQEKIPMLKVGELCQKVERLLAGAVAEAREGTEAIARPG